MPRFPSLTPSVDKFVEDQDPRVQPLFRAAAAAVPATLFGVVLGKINGSAMELNKGNPELANNPMMSAQLQAMEQMGSGNAFRFAANIGALVFTQTAVTEWSKLGRGTGEEDVWNTVSGSSASGVVFSLVSAVGTPAGPQLGSALGTGAMFGAFNALFWKIGRAMNKGKTGGKGLNGAPPIPGADRYEGVDALLASVGLSEYGKNFRRARLDDRCLPLLTESALADARLPAGPRLLVLEGNRAALEAWRRKRGGGGGGAGGAGAALGRGWEPGKGSEGERIATARHEIARGARRDGRWPSSGRGRPGGAGGRGRRPARASHGSAPADSRGSFDIEGNKREQ